MNTRNLILKALLMMVKISVSILFSYSMWNRGIASGQGKIVNNTGSSGLAEVALAGSASDTMNRLSIILLCEFLLEVTSTIVFFYLFWEILGKQTLYKDKKNWLRYTIWKKAGSKLGPQILESFNRGPNIVELMECHWKEGPLSPLGLWY